MQDYSIIENNIKTIKEMATKGDADAQNKMGICYEEGIAGVQQNYRKAFELYQKSAKQGFALGQFNMGRCFEQGTGVSQCFEKAFEWYKKAAIQGFPDAQNSLGEFYENGKGVEVNLAEAIKWYDQAALQGSAKAQNNLGNFLRYRDGTWANYLTCSRFYWTRSCFPSRSNLAFNYYYKAAKQGFKEAQFNLGSCYEHGIGVKNDFVEASMWYCSAVELLRQAVKEGNTAAQFRLGRCYYYGEGVKRDIVKAKDYIKGIVDIEPTARLFMNAMDEVFESQYEIGINYYEGIVLEKDYYKAVFWFEKASEYGNSKAQFMLGKCYEEGNGVAVDYKKAFDLFLKAANNGLAEAEYQVGNCFDNSWRHYGIERDESIFFMWYKKAAEQGFADAQKKLGYCYENGIGVEIDHDMSIMWFSKYAEQADPRLLFQEGFDYVRPENRWYCAAKAAWWYTKSAEKGFGNAQYELGKLYYNGWYGEYGGLIGGKNYKKAIDWFVKAADQGFAQAQYQLGNCYWRGLGVDKDLSKAVELYEKAVEGGSRRAQLTLASFYYFGIGVEIDKDKAVDLCIKCYEKNHVGSLSYNVIRDYPMGQACLILKAMTGTDYAHTILDTTTQEHCQYEIARKYELGADLIVEDNDKGQNRDLSLAFRWYEEAARNGYKPAYFGLGECCLYGDGVEKNQEKAVDYFTECVKSHVFNDIADVFLKAIQGDIDAQIQLGRWHWSGGGSFRRDNMKAIEWFLKAAEQGSVEAMLRLGFSYSQLLDFEKSAEWYLKAAELGDCGAQEKLGDYYGEGQGVEKNYDKAFYWYSKAAAQGKAFDKIAACYENGFGVKQNYVQAIEWYYKEADNFKTGKAQYKIGMFFKKGMGIDRDYTKAVEWFNKTYNDTKYMAYAEGEIGICYKYGHGVEKNQSIAVKCIEEAVKYGCYSRAQYEFGDCYYRGIGVEKNLENAKYWLNEAAKKEAIATTYLKAMDGDSDSQYAIGLCYKSGEDAEEDYETAFEWFCEAAERGHSKAQLEVGNCYYKGEGVEQNYEKAVDNYTKAANQGNFNALNSLGYCYYKGEGVSKDLEKAFELISKAAENGCARAQNNLGSLYYNGEPIDEDFKKAVEWYSRAAEQGDDRAQYNLGCCYANGEGVEKDLQKAEEWKSKSNETEKDTMFEIPMMLRLSFQFNNLHKKLFNDLFPLRGLPFYMFFDTETTGLPKDYNASVFDVENWPRLVQLSWIVTDKDCNVISRHDHIVYPQGYTIPEDASRIHGITTQIAREKGVPIEDVLDSFLDSSYSMLDVCHVGHNIDFDIKIIKAEITRLGFNYLKGAPFIVNKTKSICTMKSSTNYCKIPGKNGYKWPTLQELYKKLFGHEFEDAHNSMCDVEATLKCFKELKRLGIIEG